MLDKIKKDLSKLKNSEKAEIWSGFFKTGKGQYGEGDVFLGITVPEQRTIANQYSELPLRDLKKLLASNIHEHRLTSLLILIIKYRQADASGKRELFNFYLNNRKHINNWDLIDLSAPSIVGNYLLKKDKSVLYKLVESDNIWERRIAILSTFEFIKNNEFRVSLKIAELLINDKHDLLHKAVGWMLREIGKRHMLTEKKFLKKYYKKMPRTMLRYAIEKFPENIRQGYLKGRI
jgi:3-methyladenine DNA glycosylase AlkD